MFGLGRLGYVGSGQIRPAQVRLGLRFLGLGVRFAEVGRLRLRLKLKQFR